MQSLYRLFTMQREVSAVYKTIRNAAEDEFVEKRSRFIGHALPVTTEEEALDYIKAIKTKHWDARHNVYAYVLREGNIMRYSDDGEPQGTAGVPVLDVIQKSGLTDVVVVVTRYFGGILLGGGGLVRAYSHSATIGIAAAEPVTMEECAIMTLRCDYSRYPKAESLIIESGGVIDDTVFDDAVTLHLHIVPANLPKLRQSVADLTGGKGIFEEIGSDYFGMK